MNVIGLSAEEAIASRKKYGSNALSEVKRESFWSKLKENFGDPMIKILVVALIINVALTFFGQTEWYESVGIALAVIIATFVSTYSEYKNEGAFQKLQDEASRIVCKVYRDGEIQEIHIDEIVVGDAVLLQSGDKVPADGYLMDGGLAVDQSVLNGEAKEAKKVAAPVNYEQGDDIDFLTPYDLYRGSIVCSGNAVLCVTKVGDGTVYGAIANELQIDDDRQTPLQVKLTGLAQGISRFGYIGGVAIACAYLFQAIVLQNGFDAAAMAAYFSNPMAVINDIVEAVMLAVIIIVMAVPEGLPLMIALVSSMNMGKMLKDNVLVREINGIETAGSLNILFSDKTGTITKGQLEVVSFIDPSCNRYDSLEAIPQQIRDSFVQNSLENTESILTHHQGKPIPVGGNATERALLAFVAYADFEASEHINEIPFNSEQKYSAVEINYSESSRVYVKGAPEMILSRCANALAANGELVSLDIDALNKEIDHLAEKAMRVLAFAYYEGSISDDVVTDSGWVLSGLVGIRDDVRPESISAIQEMRSAGIQVVMITGDRRETAEAIAKDIGLLDSQDSLILTSANLKEMTDEELAEKLPNIRVIARALPSDKSRLVKVAQGQNLVVGMTGDGVNDSTALKRADVGFAMGGGTEVAKEAAEVVILDDNFSSIEKAVLYGRTIFNSIRKFIIFQLTINVSAVLVSFVFPLLGMANPLSITQILWINLVMDTLAALALGGEPALRRFMQEKPKRRDEAIVNGYMWSAILTGALWTFALSLVVLLSPFSHGVFRESPDGSYLLTGYFCFFIFTAIFNAFNSRTDQINLLDNIRGNKGFLKIIAVIVAVQVLMVYFGGVIFRCFGLNTQEWAFVIALALSIIPVDLLRKAIWNTVQRNTNKRI